MIKPALHFWEQQGLLHPVREQHSRYHLYDEHQMRRMRVVVLLRDAGYPFNVIQLALDELAAGRPEQAIVTVEKRGEELTRTSWSCILAFLGEGLFVGARATAAPIVVVDREVLAKQLLRPASL